MMRVFGAIVSVGAVVLLGMMIYGASMDDAQVKRLERQVAVDKMCENGLRDTPPGQARAELREACDTLQRSR